MHHPSTHPPDCSVQQYKSTEEECTRACKRDCKQVRYQIVSGQTARIVHPLSNGTKLKSNAMTSVFVAWATFEFMSVEQDNVYTWSSFIGELGGVLGLWLGLSILGIVKVRIGMKFSRKFRPRLKSK